MAFLTFRGGVHPYDGKELSKEKPITDYAPGKELVYPLSQHIGAPAKPVVKKGDHVLAGQMIAEAGGFVSAPIHASVSGTVTGIKKILNNMGSKVDAIIIENDEQYESVPDQVTESLDSLSKEEVLNKIREGGVVGMGGAGFPTHVKLSPKEPDKIEYVLVNGAECEPYLTSDYRRMMDYPDELIGGLKCMLKLFDNAKGCICIEDNKPDCIAKMTELVKDEPRIEVKTLKTKYPQGAERCLIYAVTDREINSSMLPADAGCVVDNVDTVCAVYRAVMKGEPVITIAPLSWKNSKGETSFNLSLFLKDPATTKEAPQTLAQEVDRSVKSLDAKLTIPVDMATEFMTQVAKLEGYQEDQAKKLAKQQVEGASAMGQMFRLTTLQDNTITTSLQYANGQITLNGQKMSLEDFVGMFAMPALNVPAVPAIPQQ